MPTLFADVVMSSEAAGIVVAAVAALWGWSLRSTMARTADLLRRVRQLESENRELRTQTRALMTRVDELQRELWERDPFEPGGSAGTEPGGSG